MSLSYKIIPSRSSIIMLCFSIITLSLLNITFLTGTILGIPISTTSALSYQNSTDVSFTFNPILSISISPDSITTPTIAPGTTATSNIITVNVSTNTAYGYSLLASVGNNTQYNTSDLIHNDSTMGSTFTSIATNASLPQLDTDNTWGYSFSSNHGSTWSTYHGLPLYSTVGDNTETNNPALLIDTTSPADSKSIDFRIAARASSTQPSGTYSNVINFYAVGKPQVFYMQDTSSIKSKLKNTGDELQAIDTRDGKEYWVAMQADGNIWMTQNLDLCIGCEGTATLTSRNTDLNEYGSGAYDAGYTFTDGTIIWAPNSGTLAEENVSAETFPADDYYHPHSANGGEKYIYTSNSTSSARDFIYLSKSQCIEAGHTSENCDHYHIGNYYNWNAAIASNNSEGLSSTTSIATNSICPSNWKMPDSSSSYYDSDFTKLFNAANIINMSSPYPNSYATNGFINIRISPLYFIRGGSFYDGVLSYYAERGFYLTNTSYYSGLRISALYFTNNNINTLYQNNQRSSGGSVRCLVR